MTSLSIRLLRLFQTVMSRCDVFGLYECTANGQRLDSKWTVGGPEMGGRWTATRQQVDSERTASGQQVTARTGAAGGPTCVTARLASTQLHSPNHDAISSAFWPPSPLIKKHLPPRKTHLLCEKGEREGVAEERMSRGKGEGGCARIYCDGEGYRTGDRAAGRGRNVPQVSTHTHVYRVHVVTRC